MDEASFDAYVATRTPALVGHLHAMTGDRAEAQDVVQEALVRFWALGSGGRAEVRDPDAWVRTAARRLAVSRWRRAHHRLGLLRAQPAARDVDPPGEDVVLLVAALRRLPRPQREAVVLHHLVDLPVEEVATELGIAIGTVKSRLSRGRVALRDAVGPAPGSATPSTARRPPVKEAPRAR